MATNQSTLADMPVSALGDLFAALKAALEEAGITDAMIEANPEAFADPRHPIWAQTFEKAGLGLPVAPSTKTERDTS